MSASSRSAMTSSIPSSGARAAVIERDGEKCWLCESPALVSLDVAHHIPSARIERFQFFKQMNIIPASLTNLGHPENLIPLCVSCHRAYNCDFPYWLSLPDTATLNKYIQHERRDYRRRTDAARRGERLARTLADIEPETVRYHPCIMEPTFAQAAALRPSHWPKSWGGSPIPVLLKASCALIQPCEPLMVTSVAGEGVQLGVPVALRKKCLELLDLWCRGSPIVTDQRAAKGKGKRKRSNSNDGEDKGQPSPTEHSPQPQKRTAATASTTAPTKPSARRIRGSAKQVTASPGTFTLGPNVTANDAIQMLVSSKRRK